MIPELKKQLKYIKNAIDEREREDLFRLKKVKKIIERKKKAAIKQNSWQTCRREFGGMTRAPAIPHTFFLSPCWWGLNYSLVLWERGEELKKEVRFTNQISRLTGGRFTSDFLNHPMRLDVEFLHALPNPL